MPAGWTRRFIPPRPPAIRQRENSRSPGLGGYRRAGCRYCANCIHDHRGRFAFLFLACFRAAAGAYQNLAGSVQDSTRSDAASAAVTVMDEDTGVRRTVQTSADGGYSIAGAARRPVSGDRAPARISDHGALERQSRACHRSPAGFRDAGGQHQERHHRGRRCPQHERERCVRGHDHRPGGAGAAADQRKRHPEPGGTGPRRRRYACGERRGGPVQRQRAARQHELLHGGRRGGQHRRERRRLPAQFSGQCPACHDRFRQHAEPGDHGSARRGPPA